jgi:hypothetical protein
MILDDVKGGRLKIQVGASADTELGTLLKTVSFVGGEGAAKAW